MRIASLSFSLLLGAGLSGASVAHAAPPPPPAAPMMVRPMPRPPVAVHPGLRPHAGIVIPQSGVRNGRWWYNTGFVGPWGGFPAVVGSEEGGRGGQIIAPQQTTNMWYGPRALGQIDPGYVAQPAIYDVARELGRTRSGRPVVTK